MLLDVHLLSRSDHLICTFSSHICRTSYETMQYLHPDSSHKFTSLEALWEYHEANPSVVKTVVEYGPDYEGLMPTSGICWKFFTGQTFHLAFIQLITQFTT